MTQEIEQQIEERIAELDPQIELIAVQKPNHDRLRLFIDHPDKVDLALCERVTKALGDLLAEYSLEVSSPGSDRPLTKPEHYRRFIGRRVRVRTRGAVHGRRNFTGTLRGADDEHVEVEADGEPFEIPLAEVHRSNLVPEKAEVRP